MGDIVNDVQNPKPPAIENARALSLPLPRPLPHPDAIRINFDTGEVQVTGPFCKEDIPKWAPLHMKNGLEVAFSPTSSAAPNLSAMHWRPSRTSRLFLRKAAAYFARELR